MLSVNLNGTFTRNADSFSSKERMRWMLTLAAVEQWGKHTHTQSEWVIRGQGNTNVRQSWRDRQRDRGSLDYLSTSTWWMAPLQHSCQDFTERQNTQTARCTTDKTKVGLKSVSVISVRGICGTTVFLLVQPSCVIMTETMPKRMPPQAENKNSRNKK